MSDDILDELRSEVKSFSFGLGKIYKCTEISVRVLRTGSIIKISFFCSNAKSAKNMISALESATRIKLKSCIMANAKSKTKLSRMRYSCEFVPSSECSPMQRIASKTRNKD